MIPDDVKQFIHSGPITSVWALQALAYLHTHRTRAWTVVELTRELRATQGIVRRAVLNFKSCGLVAEESKGAFRYACAPHLESVVGRLLSIYVNQPVAVTTEIYSRDSGARRFADAFKFRKE